MKSMYLAHSAKETHAAQSYADHVNAVLEKAVHYAREAMAFASLPDHGQALVHAVANAAISHDLGKLQEQNQETLCSGKMRRLPVNHVDAGTAHLLSKKKIYSAVAVAAHHRGYPDF